MRLAERIVAQMLVIDGVVLQRVEQRNEIVRFRDEHAVVLQHLDDAVDDGVHVLDMGETIGGGDDACRPVLTLDLARHLDCRNSA